MAAPGSIEGSKPAMLEREDEGAGAPLSVVVPVLNSARTLEELSGRIVEVCSRRATDWELILVNDGSGDESWGKIGSLSRRHRNIRGIDLMGNFGQHNATFAGIESAAFRVIVTLDDDLQNPPEEIPVLLDGLARGVDIVYGIPSQRHQGRGRRIAAATARRLTHLLSRGTIPVQVSSFRAFRSRLRGPAVAGLGGRRISLDAQLCRSSRGTHTVEVRHDSRRHGSSNYTLGKLVAHAMTVFATSVRSSRTLIDEPPYTVRARTPSHEGNELPR